LAKPVRAYRRWLSPLKPPTCRFLPTCSAYAIEALEVHGALRGARLAVWRILRCQPLCKGGFDPVPGTASESPDSACTAATDVDTPPKDGAPFDSTAPALHRTHR
jgi:putative membrane protein insertion efficiency factor